MAMFENSEGLDREIERLTNQLRSLDPTGDDYKAVRVSLDTLYKLRNDQYKVEMEDLEKRDRSEAELKQKANELEVRRLELEATAERMKAESKQKEEELAVKKQELALAEKKLETESKQKEEEREIRKYEIETAQKQNEAEIASCKANRVHDYVITGVNAVVGIAKLAAVIGFSMLVADQGYKFEETGVSTSRTFREQMKNSFDLIKDQFRK